jgi:hypothetical protein
MCLHDARRDVTVARSLLTEVRSAGRRAWLEHTSQDSAYPTYVEALEAAEPAVEQAEERLAAKEGGWACDPPADPPAAARHGLGERAAAAED